MKKLILLLIFTNTLCASQYAQDPHFSQYQSSPLTLNPASAGMMKEDYRLAINYRTQYWAVGNTFTTGYVSFEKRIKKLELQEAVQKWSWGIHALYDISAAGGYKNVQIGFTGIYSKPLDYEGSSYLSIGCQGAYQTRSLSDASFTFSNQFNGYQFDQSLPSYENLATRGRKSFPSFSTGLMYTKSDDNYSFYAGTSVYHINRPGTQMNNEVVYKLPIRYVMQMGYRTAVGQQANYILLNMNTMYQGKARDIMAGGAFGLVSNKFEEQRAALTIGSWYRYMDALITYLGLDWKSYQFGLSYDLVRSAIKSNTSKTGSFEISLIYKGFYKQNAFIKNVIGRDY